MCKRRLLVAWLAALCMATPAAGQLDSAALAARTAELHARTDSLVEVHRQARAAVAAEAARRWAEQRARRGELDTVPVGPFRVVGFSRNVRAAAPLFERVWQQYEPQVAGAASRLSDVLFVMHDPADQKLMAMTYERQHYGVSLPARNERRERERVARAVFGKPLRLLLPVSIQQWTGDAYFGATEELDRTYRELVLGASVGATRCLEGDIDTCTAILGLTGATDFLAFYSPAQRREMVRRRIRNHATASRCVELKQDDACDALFRLEGMVVAPAPVSQQARMALLELALRRGGRASFERLSADSSADVVTALERASGMDVRALVGAWRDEVLQARPRAATAVGRSLLVTLFWIALLITLANRSTRWRIG